jgi:hypothetical protein
LKEGRALQELAVRLFLTKEFARLARKNSVSDGDLKEAVQRAEGGLVDATIGAHLIKQRVARKGKGRSGGYRTIIFLKEGDRAVFLHMFEKSQQANLTKLEEEAYREFAKVLAALDDEAFVAAAEKRNWKEIEYEHQKEVVPERRASVSSSGRRGSSRGRRDR